MKPLSAQGAVFLTITAILIFSGVLVVVRKPSVAGPPASSTHITGESPHRTVVELDDRRQQLIGVRTARVVRGVLASKLRAAGSVTYDETRLADINLKLDGWVRELYVNYVGQRVKRNQPLLALYSPDLIAAQMQFIAALRNREQSGAAQPGDQRDYLDGLVDTPRQRLLRWDVPDDQLREMEIRRTVLPEVIFRSPASGVVIEKSVLSGMHVEAGRTLYRVADLSVVWVEADFFESDVSKLRVGTHADITLDAWPGERFSGRIAHFSPSVRVDTRTIKARVQIVNSKERLKPGMLANVEVPVKSPEGTLVPADAVVDSGGRQIVFVVQGRGRFEPRSVTVGARADGQALILEGLRNDEEVATRATFFLDSESQMQAALQDYEEPAGRASSSEPTGRPELTLRMNPDPPRAGENVVQVQVLAAGRPITDADVRVLFSMPAMPTMNMPAMRSDVRLTHASEGLYSGSATILMAGRWNLTITALQGSRTIATKQATLIAR